jgi:hypothetical protein
MGRQSHRDTDNLLHTRLHHQTTICEKAINKMDYNTTAMTANATFLFTSILWMNVTGLWTNTTSFNTTWRNITGVIDDNYYRQILCQVHYNRCSPWERYYCAGQDDIERCKRLENKCYCGGHPWHYDDLDYILLPQCAMCEDSMRGCYPYHIENGTTTVDVTDGSC